MREPGSSVESSFAHRLSEAWYTSSRWPWLLLPLMVVFYAISAARRSLYRSGVLKSSRAAVPVIVIGNIAVGGTGKTPLTLALVEALLAEGYKPGIVSRGYGSKAPHYPYQVRRGSPVIEAGDEPLLLAEQSGCPVVIAADRVAAVAALLDANDCDVVLADDGLQHYALARDIEVVVIDAKRGLGNGLLLPAGPLREPASRLDTVDFVVSNGGPAELPANTPHYIMQIQPDLLMPLDQSRQAVAPQHWGLSKTVHAVAGIGNPQRFYATLISLGFKPIEHSFNDHHNFVAADLAFDDDLPVLMTAKDAVKVRALGTTGNYWYLSVAAELDTAFIPALLERLTPIKPERRIKQ